MTNKANIVEIFSSIQGEGSYIGYRQLFIRFSGCNLACLYCDTEFNESELCNVEFSSGIGKFNTITNPVSSKELLTQIEKLTPFTHHSISLTGGEPLLNIDFLSDFLEEFKELKEKTGMRTYLETNGTLPELLKKVIKDIDIVSMDIKLGSSTGIETPWDEHLEFIKTAQKYNKEIFAKIVVTSKITEEEIAKTINTILLSYGQIPVILQPVTADDLSLVPQPHRLLSIQESLLTVLNDVRIIPQTHKYLHLL